MKLFLRDLLRDLESRPDIEIDEMQLNDSFKLKGIESTIIRLLHAFFARFLVNERVTNQT